MSTQPRLTYHPDGSPVLTDPDNREKYIHDLWEKAGSTAAIVLDHDGRRYSNQTHGTCCWHPEADGFLVELPGFSPDDVEQYDWNDYAPFWNAARLGRLRDEMLNSYPFQTMFGSEITFPFVDSDSWGEAWILFQFTDRNGQPRLAILTWENSD